MLFAQISNNLYFQFIKLHGLACGRPHDIFARCHNMLGASPDSVTLHGRKTLGGRWEDLKIFIHAKHIYASFCVYYYSFCYRPKDPITISSLSEGNQQHNVVHPSNSSVRFDLYRWSDQQCPVDYFVISYKKAIVRKIH